MATPDPIGDIKCPWCGRTAELHRSEERPKLNPDDPTPKPSYPKKYFVRCPPVTGYPGCGTTLANAAPAQARMLELGHVFGASPRAITTESQNVTPAPVSPSSSSPRRFGFWGSSSGARS